ncbi:hypothetical protein [Sinomicrobium soli]|uniref:hypothetical protein n=1 Tax=Sinomicrobium sp. N-1-3-6 TaxID=2219864 RepID=UPI000DCD3062|nr:hypothetical protein [Sinomicrobium sp. N-1-3-6]RAV29646.1 hypothetical protein DN748_05865 [Sinomicrobium sp. N-1-3-6]
MNTYIRRLAFFFTAILLFQSCDTDGVSGETGEFDTGENLPKIGVEIIRPGAVSGDRLMDISSGEVYTMSEAGEFPEKIDFIMMWGSSTGLNIIALRDIGRLTSWGSGQTINETFLVKNRTTFVKKDASEATAQLYQEISTPEQVRELYNSTVMELENDPDNDVETHGPSLSLKQLNAGDLILAKTEKGVYAAIKVESITDGNSGRAALSLRLDNREAVEVPPVASEERMDMYEVELTRPSYFDGQRFLDFSTGATYEFGGTDHLMESDAYLHQEKIDLFFFNSGSSGFNLFSPDEGSISGWGTGQDVITDWMVRNKSEFIRLDASAKADSIFLYAYQNGHIREAYNNALEEVAQQEGYDEGRHGPGSRIREFTAPGDLIFFRSESKQIYAIAQVTAITTGGSGSLTLNVKVDNSGKVNVPPPPVRELTLTGVGASTSDYIDFSQVRVLSIDEAEAEPQNIDLAHLRGTTSNHNFLSITSSGFGAWTASLREQIEAWPVRNHTGIINLGSDAAAVDLYESLDENDRQAMEEAFNTAGEPISDGRLTQIGTGDIIMLNSADRGIIVAIKVVEADNSGGMTIRFKVSQE